MEPTVTPVRLDGEEFEIEAAYLAEHLHLDPVEVPVLLRNRLLQSLCERGEGEDAGRYRLTFRLGRSRLTLLVDESGNILQRASIHFPRSQSAKPVA